MEVLPGTVSRPLPDSLVGTYRSLHRFRKEDMASLTLAAYEGRESQEETVRRLTDAGIDADLATWYVGEVWRSGAPVAPYSGEGESLESPEEGTTRPENPIRPVLIAAAAVIVIQAGAIWVMNNPSAIAAKDEESVVLGINLGLKVSQAALVYFLAVAKGKRAVFYTTLSLLFGWLVILFLLLARPWRLGRVTGQSPV